MDRIGEALERARREREKLGPVPVPAPVPADQPAPLHIPGLSPRVAAAQAAPQPQVSPAPAQPQLQTVTQFAPPPAAQPAAAAPVPPVTSLPTPPATVRRGPAQIVYTKTRQVILEQDRLRENRIVTGPQEEQFTQAFKILRTQILAAIRDNEWNALAITSPGDSDGKSVVAINLAIHLAAEVDRTVLLVDANLRQPEIHEYFGISGTPGLSEYLVDNVPLETMLVNPSIPRLVVLPGGRPIQNSAEMLSSRMMADLVSELKRRYPQRIVLFDLPPVLTQSDAMAFAPYVDGTILVAAQGHTKHQDIERATELLGNSNLLGVVLNKAKPEKLRDPDARPPFWKRWVGLA
jgi:protein-tyrosine kinase